MRYFKSKLKKIVSEKMGKSITHEEIAGITGVRRQTITTWMGDRPFRRLDMAVLEPLAEWLEVNTEDLYEVVDVAESPEYNPAALLTF